VTKKQNLIEEFLRLYSQIINDINKKEEEVVRK